MVAVASRHSAGVGSSRTYGVGGLVRDAGTGGGSPGRETEYVARSLRDQGRAARREAH